ncbi:SRPBCC family protein [Piscinibacter defluvii]|uniref:SRPBCC family protein n=1 Tax=Piscinibacter defluvii TaxID=1796922 RepID=UPI000FDE029D|nr:SRPBCC family protein [Piscinibacter defluvii]
MDADVRFPLHHRCEALLAVDSACLFAHLDDHRRLSSRIEHPAMLTSGASMRVETDGRNGQALGLVNRMTGRVLGLRLSLVEVVTADEPSRQEAWEAVGEPRLLVICRMGLEIERVPGASCSAAPARGQSLH